MEKLEVLAASPLLQMLSSQELEYVAELARPRRFKRGSMIIEEGAQGDCIYVIAEGEVEVSRHQATGGERALAVLKPKEFFGEMSLIDKEHRSATVRARTDTEVLQLTVDNLAAFRRRYREAFTFIVINIARILSSRLRAADSQLATMA